MYEVLSASLSAIGLGQGLEMLFSQRADDGQRVTDA